MASHEMNGGHGHPGMLTNTSTQLTARGSQEPGVQTADALSAVMDELTSDPSNAWARDLGYRPVWAGSPSARIAIIGQAPGRRAQESGVPWDDASGVRLRSWLGVHDDEFYDPALFAIVPMDFYFPGKGNKGDLPPRRDFAPRWHSRILAALPNIALRVLIGAYAQRFYLAGRAKANLTQTVRSYREYLPAEFPLVHPSPLNYGWHADNPWFTADVVPELARRVSVLLRHSRTRMPARPPTFHRGVAAPPQKV